MSNKSKLKENSGLNLSVSKADYKDNEQTLDNAVGTDGSITISNKPKGVGMTTESDVNESMNGNSEQQAFFAGLIEGNSSHEGTFVGEMSKNRLALMAWERYKSNQLPEIPDEERFERGNEYGIRGESFDKLMEDLKKSSAPKIKINETINPRIKKSDLINYIKNKK